MLLALFACAAASSTGGKPNIVLFLQDDQDYVMGGWRPLKQTLRDIAGKGLFATNWMIHTPVCCPSRAELLSGRFFHNLRMPTEHGGCMHIQTGVKGVEDKPNEHSFAKHLVTQAGYTAAWLGKHMNACPREPPPGYDCPTCRWFTNGGGQDTEPGGYISATFNDFSGKIPANGTLSRNGTYWSWLPGAPTDPNDGYRKLPQWGGYTTSIIANKSIEWLHAVAGPSVPRAADGTLSTPFVLTVAPKAPHYAATPAPWHLHNTWVDEEAPRAPRTPDFGVDPAVLSGHHAMIAGQPVLRADERAAIDRQFRKRWKALMSVDDAVAGVVRTLDELSLWATTYFFVTSDHGYNLGQHNIPSCKLNVYDHSIRIPMMIRGPGIATTGARNFTELGSNTDLAPTFLALAGIDPLPSAMAQLDPSAPPMDGKSLLPWLLADADADVDVGAATASNPLSAGTADTQEEDGRAHARTQQTLLPSATRAQLRRERARLGLEPTAQSLPRVREAHWVEFYSLGDLTICGGGTCKGDRDDPYGYCHYPCDDNFTCPSLACCYNVTCCGEANTEFSSLEGMRCGAGHKPGSLPFNTSDDPGHLADSVHSNTYRALRFVDPKRGNRLYAEFTALANYNFTNESAIFVEVFDCEADPGQLVNLANKTSAEDLRYYREATRRQFGCAGGTCD